MALTQLSEKETATRVHLLLEAEGLKHLMLVDERGGRVEFRDVWDTPCWAHLRDAKDEQVFVHPVRGSKELLEPRYLALLGLSV